MIRVIGILAVLWAVTVAHAGNEGKESKMEAGTRPVKADKADTLHPRVLMATTMGDIVLELDAEHAPISTWNFIRHVDYHHYEDTIFHRVVPNYLIQGGGYTEDLARKRFPFEPIQNEWKNGLKHLRGTVAMARKLGAPDSARSEFFINVVDDPYLDKPQDDGAGFAVFGKVVEAMETVDRIAEVQVDVHPALAGGREATVPTIPIVINKVRMLGTVDEDKLEQLAKRAEEKLAAADEAAHAKRKKQMDALTKKYEKETGLSATVKPSGLRFIDLKKGDGPTPSQRDHVKVHYTGWLVDGTKFDSSHDRGEPYGFSLSGGVIEGWLEGVASMKVGGKRKLIIPPDLGYGAKGFGDIIPPDAPLIFDVELISITK